MHDAGVGHDVEGVARLAGAQRPVRVLAVEEEPLVEQSDLLEDGSRHEHGCAAAAIGLDHE